MFAISSGVDKLRPVVIFGGMTKPGVVTVVAQVVYNLRTFRSIRANLVQLIF